MAQEYLAGVGSYRLARKYVVSESTVLARLRRMGIETSVSEVELQQRADDTAEMGRLRQAGWTYRAIGERFGLTRQGVAKRVSAQESSSS